MPLERPTLAQIIDTVRGDLVSRLPGTDPTLRRSNLGILGRMLAGQSHLLRGTIDWVWRQLFPDTADGDELQRHADLHLTVPRVGAVASNGTISLTGTTGTLVPTGTRWQRSDGAEYESTADVTLAAGAGTASVQAVDAGADGDVVTGQALTSVSPISGLDSTAIVDAPGIAGGIDQESDDQLRQRLGDYLRQPPHGGADFDYRYWALEVPGVTRAWALAHGMGTGTVVLYFVRDGDATLIPDAAEVAAVQAYIDPLRPVTVAGLYVVAPTASPLDFTFSSIVDAAGNPAPAETKTAVEEALADLISREAEPGGVGVWSGVLHISRIREAISSAAGEYNHVLASPTADQTPGAGEIITMGSVTWP